MYYKITILNKIIYKITLTNVVSSFKRFISKTVVYNNQYYTCKYNTYIQSYNNGQLCTKGRRFVRILSFILEFLTLNRYLSDC